MSDRRLQGFTLLELLVALAIFAFLGALAYGGLAAMLRISDGATNTREALAAQQRGLRILEEDMSFVLDRPVRDGLGSPHLAFMSGRDGETLLEFTRSSRARMDLLPAPMERVRYVLEGGNLVRQTWNPPDAARLEPDFSLILWRDVESVTLGFIDRELHTYGSWPPPNVANPGLPRAVDIHLKPRGQAEIRRLMLLPEFPASTGTTP
ncbi:MAG: type II secretion system minor pseudopilin GspJ [Halothiobacillaceae bacterium]